MPYYVAHGKSITSKRGIITSESDQPEVTAACIGGDKKRLDALVKAGHLVKADANPADADRAAAEEAQAEAEAKAAADAVEAREAASEAPKAAAEAAAGKQATADTKAAKRAQSDADAASKSSGKGAAPKGE